MPSSSVRSPIARGKRPKTIRSIWLMSATTMPNSPTPSSASGIWHRSRPRRAERSGAAAQVEQAAFDVIDLNMIGIGQMQRVNHVAPGLPVVELVDDSIEPIAGLDGALVFQ